MPAVNENTRRQYERYVVDRPWLTTFERMVLYWLVHDHCAAEGVARPGLQRLETVTGAEHRTITKALRTMLERGDIVLKHRWPNVTRKADEYALPWLENKPARPPAREISRAQRGSPAREISRAHARDDAREISRPFSRASSPLKRSKGTPAAAPRNSAAVASAADAAPPRDCTVCAICERPITELADVDTCPNGLPPRWRSCAIADRSRPTKEDH